MTFPGYPIADDKQNVTDQVDDHPDHHNALAVAANGLQVQVDTHTAATTAHGSNGAIVGANDLGTAAAADTGDFATAAQGATADTAVQPAALASGLAAKADASDLTAHENATTSVHGITDTSALLKTADIGGSVQAHNADLDTLASLGVVSDPATGRLAIGGIEMGDTGWRRILSWTSGTQDGTNQIGTIDTAKFTLAGNGWIDLRRSKGDVVEIRSGSTVGQDISSTSATVTQLLTTSAWPDGFRSDQFGTRAALTARNVSTIMAIEQRGPGTFLIETPQGAVALQSMTARWTTANDWPSSLPGTAAP